MRDTGITHHSASATATMATPATRYTSVQPPTSDSSPATLRAARMPVSSPLITSPTARPLRPGAARVAASGTSTCAATENRPVSSVPSASMA